ncbi:unnamed protein product, partial [Adineta steineri]
MIITQIIGEDTGSIIMSLVPDSKFQCANTTCLPFINIITSNVRNCQVACLTQSQCRAATFHRSTSNCKLFADMSNENENMLTDVDASSMNVIRGTRFPAEIVIIRNRLRHQHQQQHPHPPRHQHQQQHPPRHQHQQQHPPRHQHQQQHPPRHQHQQQHPPRHQ